jgi:hypothetical protein
VDFASQTIRLEPGTTKNGEGRTFPFGTFPELAELLTAQRDATRQLERQSGQVIPWVFHHRGGQQVRYFYGAWTKACREAGVPGRIFHDFRRTAVRNLERAGVPRSVAMKLTGHKTEAVYRRYAIVCESDLAEGVAKLAQLGLGHRTEALRAASAAGSSTVLTQSEASGTSRDSERSRNLLRDLVPGPRLELGRACAQRILRADDTTEAPDTIGAEPAPDAPEE